MSWPSAVDLVRWWPPATTSAHQRLSALLTALDGHHARELTLGSHHQRLLEIHQAVVGTPLEAVVACRHCDAENEFVVPVVQILELPAPEPPTVVEVEVSGVVTTYRLPSVEDLAATGGLPFDAAVRLLAARTRAGGPTPVELDDEAVARLATAWEHADPAASLTVDLDCVSCGATLTASVDPAEFVARDLDRLVRDLLGEVHGIAVAYGWSESEILALPPDRRRRYLELIGSRPAGARRPLTSVSS